MAAFTSVCHFAETFGHSLETRGHMDQESQGLMENSDLLTTEIAYQSCLPGARRRKGNTAPVQTDQVKQAMHILTWAGGSSICVKLSFFNHTGNDEPPVWS